MDRLIYTGLSALRAITTRQAAVANNLANASTTGFRAEMTSVRPLWLDGAGHDDRAFASGEVTAADLKAGAVSATGRPLDVAMERNAMLAVQAPDGSEGYTRRGDLSVAASGLLTTGDGVPVIGDGGPIAVPPHDDIRIDAEGAVWIVPQGGDPAQPQQIDRLRLVDATGAMVTKGLDGLFRPTNGGVLAADPLARVIPASLEGSNVNTATALVGMIDAARSWENQLKLMATAKELDAATTNLMRLPS